MPRWQIVVLALTLTVVLPAAAAPPKATPAKESRDGWPETPEGAAGRAYVRAFNAGDDAMVAFYRASFHPDSLAKRPPEKRLTRYRELRERFGTLQFASIVKSVPGELTVKLLDADLAPREFVFTLETRSPYRVKTVSMRQTMGGHGGGGGFQHR